MVFAMTPEQHKTASDKVDVLKEQVKPQTATVKLTKEEQIIYNSIPDRWKNQGIQLMKVRGTWNPELDQRLALFKKGLVRIWQFRPQYKQAFNIGFEVNGE